MWNGFYDIKGLVKAELVSLYTEALDISSSARVDMKLNSSFERNKTDFSPQEFITKFLDKNLHNTIINRYVKNNCEEWSPIEGEIGSITYVKDKTYYLYIILDLKQFNSLVQKYNLKRKII
jgi:hypothetical protein